MSTRDSLSPVLFGQVASPPHLLSPQTTGPASDAWPSHINRDAMDHGPNVNSTPRGNGNEYNMDGSTTSATDLQPSVAAESHAQDGPTPAEDAGPSIPAAHPQAAEISATEDTAPSTADVLSSTTNPESSGEDRTTMETSASVPEPEPGSGPAGSQVQEVEAISVAQEQEPPQQQESESNSPDPEDEVPAWVKFEEDTSVPDDEELKEIENSEDDKWSASDIPCMEKKFFWDEENSEMRPVKKLRLSWLIKGVRGTRERPNHARVMHSPGALVDGLYWSIKFYPRGDSCSSLSAFIRCSKEPPPVDEEGPESCLTCYEGAPDTNFSGAIEPQMVLNTPYREHKKQQVDRSKDDKPATNDAKSTGEDISSEESSDASAPTPPEKTEAEAPNVDKTEKELLNWRISAQLGVVMYNPKEPRTMYVQSDGHQFSRSCDDWGWVDFVRPWDEIHRRKRGQRRPLLQEDTLAIDAYVRIYEDPTQALWWHDSSLETQWPSKELAGYFPMGTPTLYHSPAVAGITAWMLLAPFREVIQAADGGQWRTNSDVEPKPLICQSQLVLDQMRNLTSDGYVNLYKLIEEFLEVSERWNDVRSFWEVFRRGLEVELAGDKEALEKLSAIFDANGSPFVMPPLPVPGSPDIQRGVAKCLDDRSIKGPFPNFLPVMLDRQKFDTRTRQWRLHHDRVRLNDELDLSQWCSDDDSTYTLYGFVAHVGRRNSGKFYSVLRPKGINTKWLAFEDGNGNKVHSYPTKRIKEYEGLQGEALREFTNTQTRENAYLAMYIKTSVFKDYLTDDLEPYKMPRWFKPWVDDARDDDDDDGRENQKALATQAALESPKPDRENATVELYLDECVKGGEDMLNFHDLRISLAAKQMRRTLVVGKDKTFKDLRRAIAQAFALEDYHKTQLWEIHYQGLGKYSRAVLEPISYRRKVVEEAVPGQVLRLWLTVRQPVSEQTSYSHLLDQLGESSLSYKPTQPTQEETGVVAESVPTENPEIGESAEIQPAPIEGQEEVSGPDAEQVSVRDAVAADIQRVSETVENANDGDGVTVAAISISTESNVAETSEPAPDANTQVSEMESATGSTTETLESESVRPVVHGHLIDAAEFHPTAAEMAIAQAAANAVHDAAAALEQALAEEIVITDTPGAENGNAGEPAPVENAHRTRAPAPVHTPRSYGIIHYFDTDQQKFVARHFFHPEIESEIGRAVRKSLDFSDEKEFRVWKRQGASGMESISLSTSFVSAGLQGVFTLIVGDILSEEKIDELKAAGKFWQPQQLTRYLFMAQRKHPYLSLTSTGAVEMAEFGSDYYKGPLVRGRPHGEKGFLITSSGCTYEGPFVAGQKSGANGKITYQNGDTYLGEWFNDEKHGQGEFIEQRTGNRYVGGFENGRRWGVGTTYWQMADQQADMCQICYEEDIDALFYDCGHVCACFACAKQCDTCPICRRSVRQAVKMYRA